MFAAEVRGDDDGVDFADDVLGRGGDLRNEGAFRDVLGGETTFTRAMDVRDLRSRNSETFSRFLVEVGGDAGERALGGHGLAVVAIEHGAPRIRMAVARGATKQGEADVGGIGNETHAAFIRR